MPSPFRPRTPRLAPPGRPARLSLEVLEGRDLPSFLLSGATAVLAQPLNDMVTDLQTAQADLANQVNTLKAPGSLTQYEHAFSSSVSDYQRMLSDQHAVDALARADQAFLSQVAYFEALTGDSTDLLVLVLGPYYGINVMSQFTTPMTSADSAVNSAAVQAEVNAEYPFRGVSIQLFQETIAQATTTPTF